MTDIELDDVGQPFLQPSKKAPTAPGIDWAFQASRPVTDKYDVLFEGYELHVDSQDWRTSTLLKLQIFAGYLNFTLFGLGDQTIGTIIPRLEEYYEADDSQTALIFLASTAGYFTMAMITEALHRKLGVRGVGILGTACMSFAYLVLFQKPPFFVFVSVCFFLGLGCGSLDASFNGWMGNLMDSNQLLGILHGCYGIGCMISPPLVTWLMERSKNPWDWNQYYLVLSVYAASCMVFFAIVFRNETAAKYKYDVLLKEARRQHADQKNDPDFDDTVDLSSMSSESESASLTMSLRSKLVWLLSVIMFLYVGSEVAFGTWLVTFMTRIKHTSFVYASYLATTFWLGLTLGRIFLGFVTAYYFKNELNANLCYIVCSLVGNVCFCLLALTPYLNAMFPVVLLLGLFVGPIFPTTVTAAIAVLPVKFHASGVGFICAFGGGGAAAIPFLVGLVAETSDVGLRFYPFIIAFFYAILSAAWYLLKLRNSNKLP